VSDGLGRARHLWDRFWFEPAPAVNLAAARILFAAHALWVLLSRDIPALSALPPVFWDWLPDPARWRYLLWEGHPQREYAVQAVAIAALLAAVAGVAARASCFVAGLALYHLAPLETWFLTPTPWSKDLTMSLLALLVLSAAPCADALAPGRRAAGPAPPSGDYSWPLKLAQLFLCQVYFFAGYAKVALVGWEWASPENMSRWLILASQQDEFAVFTGVGAWIARQPALCALLGAGTLALELAFPIVLFSRRARAVLVPAAALFHVGIVFAMNMVFLNLPQLLVFMDWDALGRRLRSARRSAPAPA
jgi:hypothetical protein